MGTLVCVTPWRRRCRHTSCDSLDLTAMDIIPGPRRAIAKGQKPKKAIIQSEASIMEFLTIEQLARTSENWRRNHILGRSGIRQWKAAHDFPYYQGKNRGKLRLCLLRGRGMAPTRINCRDATPGL